eukprot:1156365-Pelagomonas_calceolata.AAC.9
MFPCNECAKLLIQAGIREVVFNEVGLPRVQRRSWTLLQFWTANVEMICQHSVPWPTTFNT